MVKLCGVGLSYALELLKLFMFENLNMVARKQYNKSTSKCLDTKAVI